MPNRIIRNLTLEEVALEIYNQEADGKHKGQNLNIDWNKLLTYGARESQFRMPGEKPFLLIEINLNLLTQNHHPESEKLIRIYTEQPTDFPPIFIGLSTRQLNHLLANNQPIKATIVNGNHRFESAIMRGQNSITAICNWETWLNLVLANAV